MPNTACKKKLYKCRPRPEKDDLRVEAQWTRRRTRQVPADPLSIERGVRQMLANKVSGHLVGMWLLVVEHLRLGTWDLLCGWTNRPTEYVEPRLALQLIHESALCTAGIRCDRTLTNRGGFELINGLHFIANDVAMHDLLAAHTVDDAIRLQVGLGKLRRAAGDFCGKVLAIDPHRIRSYSKRHMRRRAKKSGEVPLKMSQTFWLLDADTCQPVCFTSATSAQTVTQATPPLMTMAADILGLQDTTALVLADAEHVSIELLEHVGRHDSFELLVPMSSTKQLRKQLEAIPQEQFTPRWAGIATAKQRYEMKKRRDDEPPFYQYVQRNGERPEDWQYKAFLSTFESDEVEALTVEFPKRWHVEEFFNANQALGWNRAGTQNLNVRYGQMTLALIAQAAIHQLRMRIGDPVCGWDADHLSQDLFQGLDGDVRVKDDTIVVTYYNAPNPDLLRTHYEGLPAKLEAEQVDPRIPWLCGFKLDFRFR